MTIRKFSNNSTVIKGFNFSTLAHLGVEGVGLANGGFSISLIVKEENVEEGKHLYVSATGRSNAAKAAGNGSLLFWCKVINLTDGREYVLDRRKGESFAVGFDDVLIGSAMLFLPKKINHPPSIQVKAGYIFDSGYTGLATPFPSELSKIVRLKPFKDEP